MPICWQRAVINDGYTSTYKLGLVNPAVRVYLYSPGQMSPVRS